MPQEIVFEKLPAGYADSAAKPGEKVKVRLTDFVSTEDGDELITKLEGFPQQILSMLSVPSPVLPSMVHSLLAIIRADKTATVYLNEAQTIGEMRVKGGVKKGELLTTNRVLDLGRIKFKDITVPPEAGIAYVFSVGWRKGFFYDLAPLHAEHDARPYDIEEAIGSLFAYLLFQERFKIDDPTWKIFFDQKWFPFVHLDNDLICEMIAHAKQGWHIDGLLPKIVNNVKRLLRDDPIDQKHIPAFVDHADILRTGVERYLADDHVSATSIMYPRIEGTLRSFLRVSSATATAPTAQTLSKVAVEHHQTSRISNSLLLSTKFQRYLNDVYFAHFAPGSSPDVGRHSVAHGEARAADFTVKAATIPFLLLYQLSLFFTDGKLRP